MPYTSKLGAACRPDVLLYQGIEVHHHTWAVPCGVVTSSTVFASKCSPVGLAWDRMLPVLSLPDMLPEQF
jgi:hypothetical protein